MKKLHLLLTLAAVCAALPWVGASVDAQTYAPTTGGKVSFSSSGGDIWFYAFNYEGDNTVVWIDMDHSGSHTAGDIDLPNGLGVEKHTIAAGTYTLYGSPSLLGIKGEHFSNQSKALTAVDVTACPALTGVQVEYSRVLTELKASNMPNLIDIDCESNEIMTNLECSGCPNLLYLYCGNNKLTSLNLAGLEKLESLDCHANPLTSLDLSGLTSLKTLTCGKTDITTLDLSGRSNLTEVNCHESPNLATIKLTGCTALKMLEADHSALTGLDARGCTSLGLLSCSDNQISSLNLEGCTEVHQIFCPNNKLTALNTTGLTKLWSIYCGGNNFTELSVADLPELLEIYCANSPGLVKLSLSNNSKLQTVDLENCPSLKELTLTDGALTALNLSNLASLRTLNCSNNKIESLDVTQNTALTDLNCSNNNLTTLDLNYSTALKTLNCSGNKLTSPNVTECPALVDLDCSRNGTVTSVIISSSNSALNVIKVFGNQLNDKEIITEFVADLPQRLPEDKAKLIFYDKVGEGEGNAMSRENVEAAKAKNWQVYSFLGFVGSGYSTEPYSGFDKMLKVSYSAEEGGTLTATVANNSEVANGTQVTFTATPNANWQVENWKVNGTVVTQNVEGIEETFTGNEYKLTIEEAVTVTVTFKDHTGVAGVTGAAVLTVYPNPASNVLNVSGLVPAAEVRLVNLSGREVATTQADAGGNALFNVADLPQGEYLLISSSVARKVAIRR